LYIITCVEKQCTWPLRPSMYRVFKKEWTDFELLSWPYYMQVFAETTFNVKGIVWHFMANFYEPISSSPSQPLDDWDTLLSGLQTRRNHRKTIKWGPKVNAFMPLSMLGMAYWVPTGLKKPVKRPISILCYRDVIKNLTSVDFYDDIFETYSWGSAPNGLVHLTWGFTSYCPWLLIWKGFSILASLPTDHEWVPYCPDLNLLDFWLWGAAKTILVLLTSP